VKAVEEYGKRQVLVGMSGGVDSSAAVALLKAEGYQVFGHTLLLTDGVCGGEDSIREAARSADRMGVAHSWSDGRSLFARQVQDYFVHSYEQGLTPNPCIRCNREVKFLVLLAEAARRQIPYVATGHYARIQRQGDRYLLQRGRDPQKDQSYFLYSLTSDQLSRILFPLGDLTKDQVRQLAGDAGLDNAMKKDSQDICFIPDGDYGAFLERYTGTCWPEGDFLDREGNVLGRHRGHVRYTLGQRRGLNVALGRRVYVTGKDPRSNTVTLGSNEELYTTSVRAGAVNFLACDSLSGPVRLMGKTRHSQTLAPCTVIQTGESELLARFDQPQRAATPGQAIVLYEGDTVVCGGTIL